MPKKGELTAERVTITCPCGKEFSVTKTRYEAGRGRRCSKECQRKFMTRPSGLKYNIVKVNPTRFPPGHVPWNKGAKGAQVAWNKGRPSGVIPPTAFKPGEMSGEANCRWAGDDVGYQGLHIRVYNERGPAVDYPCQHADETCKGPMHWANISGRYESVDDFMPLCQSHHARYDRRLRLRGSW
jgi:hypothetical protein